MPPDDPIVLTSVPSEMIASLILSRLRNEGIRAEMTGGLTAGFRVEVPGTVQILILPQDQPRARELLKEWESQKQPPSETDELDELNPTLEAQEPEQVEEDEEPDEDHQPNPEKIDTP